MKIKHVFIPLLFDWGISIMPHDSMRIIQDKRPDLFGPDSPYSIHGFFDGSIWVAWLKWVPKKRK
jgi:hypothetical protein